MVAKTLFGFEELLAKELTQLGAQKVEQGVRVVSFMGDKGFMYKANLGLRTAIKILKPIKSFRVINEQDLYEKVKAISWENYLKSSGSLAIDATVHSHIFTHSQYIALKEGILNPDVSVLFLVVNKRIAKVPQLRSIVLLFSLNSNIGYFLRLFSLCQWWYSYYESRRKFNIIFISSVYIKV